MEAGNAPLPCLMVAVRCHTTMNQHFYAKTCRLDVGGAAASLMCALHCALLPLVVTLLPLVGLSFLAGEAVEWILLALSAALGISSLCLGYREHRSRRALSVLAIGLALLAVGRMIEHLELSSIGVPLLVAGGLIVAASHALNHFLCRNCGVCHSPHQQTQHDCNPDHPNGGVS